MRDTSKSSAKNGKDETWHKRNIEIFGESLEDLANSKECLEWKLKA